MEIFPKPRIFLFRPDHWLRELIPESLARILADEGSFEEALMYLEQAHEIAPKDVAPFFTESIAERCLSLGVMLMP